MTSPATIRKDVARRWGNGWERLTQEMQEALIAREVLSIANMQAQRTLDANPALVEILATYNAALEPR